MKFAPNNRLLRALPAPDLERLRPLLEPVPLARRQVLEAVGTKTAYAHFLETGLAAVVAHSPRREVGIGVIGTDGMTGLDIVQAAGYAANETLVQAAGTALRIAAGDLDQALLESPNLRTVLLRYSHVFMVQASQTALTNAQASMVERVARWILMSYDRLARDALTVTHDFIALMLAVHRPRITIALHLLEGRGLIRSTRETIRVLDREGLIAVASGSYGVCEAEFERLIDGSWRATVPPRSPVGRQRTSTSV